MLEVPALIIPSLQVNIRAGSFPSPDGNGVSYLRVPLNMLKKWMGHASIETTAIYADAVGKEEQEIAARMWSS